MTPVVPAFAGHVPKALAQKYPHLNITRQSWNHFPATYLLDATERLFFDIGTTFVREYIKEFGTDHLYNCDTFNEMDPASNQPNYIRNSAEAIYKVEFPKEAKNYSISFFDFVHRLWKVKIPTLFGSCKVGYLLILTSGRSHRSKPYCQEHLRDP